MVNINGPRNDITQGQASEVNRTHGDGSLSCARLASDQYGPASNVAVFDHLQDDASCPTRGQLANHPLRHLEHNVCVFINFTLMSVTSQGYRCKSG